MDSTFDRGALKARIYVVFFLFAEGGALELGEGVKLEAKWLIANNNHGYFSSYSTPPPPPPLPSPTVIAKRLIIQLRGRKS